METLYPGRSRFRKRNPLLNFSDIKESGIKIVYSKLDSIIKK